MEAYNPALLEKPQMVLINKMDLYGPDRRDLRTLQMALEKVGIESLPISALTGEGLEGLKKFIAEKWGED
jgi:GTP-binding protein